MSSCLSCALSLKCYISFLSTPCRSVDSPCMESGTSSLLCLSLHACPWSVPTSSSESGGASWLSLYHDSGTHSSMLQTGHLSRGYWQRSLSLASLSWWFYSSWVLQPSDLIAASFSRMATWVTRLMWVISFHTMNCDKRHRQLSEAYSNCKLLQ